MLHNLDPHRKAPEHIRNVYKSFQKKEKLDGDPDLLDFENAGKQSQIMNQVGVLHHDDIIEACLALEDENVEEIRESLPDECLDRPIYEHPLVPVPSLIPPRSQIFLLSRLLHRDLSNPEHLTNLHFHHKLPYSDTSDSFFAYKPESGVQLEPLDPKVHKSIPLQQALSKKLRWVTLGGQYDWTAKVYPPEKPPDFPPDVARFLETLFPEMKALAAIVNFYTPGDILNMHRDVAEESENGLVSISLGCDAIFLVGLGNDNQSGTTKEDNIQPLPIRLRSGDAVFMSGDSRFAWHGVPQIVPNTCPKYLEDWPADSTKEDSKYEHWRGWMKRKRVNLNVRQMWD